MTKRLVFAVIGLSALAACSLDPKDYESDPVTVATPEGPVVCQLYTKELVRWDRAISRPATMSVAIGDAICLEEGAKLRG